MSKVSLVKCDTYEQARVDEAVGSALDHLGGINAFVRPGMKVLIKPNLLMSAPLDRCVTTHPAVVAAVVGQVRAAGGQVLVGDSPAIGAYAKITARAGLAQLAEQMDFPLVELGPPVKCAPPSGSLYKQLELAEQALSADAVINLPKLKTHGQALLTLGVKNMFGTVVAQRKAEWHHMVGLSRDNFASLLLDIYLTVGPVLTILDGVWAMEGHGPSNGRPRKLGLIAASSDAVALDTLIAGLLGANLSQFPLHRTARARGIGQTDPTAIQTLGASVEELRPEGFEIPSLDHMGMLPGFLEGLTQRYLVSRPVQTPGSCAACGSCVAICPELAITRRKNHLTFDYAKCIRCYCCQEVCPENAIAFKKGLIVRLLDRFKR